MAKKILFVHQNFPGQFRHLVGACVKSGYAVTGIGQRHCPMMPGVQYYRYDLPSKDHFARSNWVSEFETKVIRAQAVFNTAKSMSSDGYKPDLIVAHPGWGEAILLKQVWPTARLGLYAEFFYRADGADVGFDLEFANQSDQPGPRLLIKNAANYLQFSTAEAYLAPTEWQASTYPSDWRSRLTVIHDGVDTGQLKPEPRNHRVLELADGTRLSAQEEVVTFVSRNLEPYRGYHIFLRSLPELFSLRPNIHVLIVGGSDTSYGAKPPSGQTWRDYFWSEVKNQVPNSRVHFLGRLPYHQFQSVMQRSDVHAYLTYPFVLSWSLLEAMSLGKAIVASDTAPVREVITDKLEGLLVPFFETKAFAQAISKLLSDPDYRRKLGHAAREKVVRFYDLNHCSLPKQLAWLDNLAQSPLRPQ
jgi:glycosyltransferase involved in cell wall biosynthesis